MRRKRPRCKRRACSRPPAPEQVQCEVVGTLLADPEAVTAEEAALPETAAAVAELPCAVEAPQVPERSCTSCESPMGPEQDWCLQCGTGAPGSLRGDSPGWRSALTLLTATALLALAAAAASYAALNQSKGRTVAVTRVLTQSAPLEATSAATATSSPRLPPTVTGTLTSKPKTPTPHGEGPAAPAANGLLFGSSGSNAPGTPPSATAAPEPSGAPTSSAGGPASKPSAPHPSGGSNTGGEPPAKAIALDTNAARTYDPYGYPAGDFGDPRLAIDGEASTAWTAQVNPAAAPKMAEGLVIDLKTAQKLTALELLTTTPGMEVALYGSDRHPLPSSITDHGWVKLSPNETVKDKHTRIRLTTAGAFRFVSLWISRAPVASTGTPQAPGEISINELKLF